MVSIKNIRSFVILSNGLACTENIPFTSINISVLNGKQFIFTYPINDISIDMQEQIDIIADYCRQKEYILQFNYYSNINPKYFYIKKIDSERIPKQAPTYTKYTFIIKEITIMTNQNGQIVINNNISTRDNASIFANAGGVTQNNTIGIDYSFVDNLIKQLQNSSDTIENKENAIALANEMKQKPKKDWGEIAMKIVEIGGKVATVAIPFVSQLTGSK